MRVQNTHPSLLLTALSGCYQNGDVLTQDAGVRADAVTQDTALDTPPTPTTGDPLHCETAPLVPIDARIENINPTGALSSQEGSCWEPNNEKPSAATVERTLLVGSDGPDMSPLVGTLQRLVGGGMTMKRKALGYAALALATAPGCYESSNVLTRDTGVAIDTRTATTTDAPSAIDANIAVDAHTHIAVDAHTHIAVDAHTHIAVDAHDPTPCTGVSWIDSTPALLSVSTAVPLRLISTGTAFEFFFQNTELGFCDSPCPMLLETPSTGAFPLPQPAYWAPVNPDGLAAGLIGGAPVFAAHRGTVVSWVTGTPAANPMWIEGTTRDFAAQVPMGHVLAEVVLDGVTSRLYFATHRDRGMPDRYFDAFALHGIALDGSGLREVEIDPFLAMEHTRLRLHAGARDLIAAGIQRWDFPASVQIEGLATDFAINGSSCGTDDYAVTSNTSAVAIAQGCGAGSARSEVRMHLRTFLSAERDERIASDRFVEADSPLAAQSNPDSGGWVVAYWNQDGFLALVSLNADLTVATRAIVPGPSFAWAETFPGPIALSRNADGTFAIAWSATNGGGDTGALQRFTLGCD